MDEEIKELKEENKELKKQIIKLKIQIKKGIEYVKEQAIYSRGLKGARVDDIKLFKILEGKK